MLRLSPARHYPALVRGVLKALLPFAAVGCASRNVVDAESLRRITGDPSTQTQPIVLENVRIIDGTGASAIDRGWIQIERGRIVAMGAGDAPTVPNANVADLAGKTVFPGLSDMHVHIGRLAQAKWMLKALLAHGVTNVKEPGNWAGPDGVNHDIPLKRWLTTDSITPHVYISGWTMSGPPSRPMSAGPELQRMIDNNLAIGVDFFKTHQGISLAGMTQVSKAAKAHNIIHTGHVPDNVRSIDALDSGLVVIEHLGIQPSEISDAPNTAGRSVWANIDLNSAAVQRALNEWEKRKDRFFIDPTLVVASQFVVRSGLLGDWPHDTSSRIYTAAMRRQWLTGREPGGRPDLPASQQSTAPRALTDSAKAAAIRSQRNQARFVTLAYRRGIRVLTGTDMPIARLTPGESLLRELELFVLEGGMKPEEAIHASTGMAAKVFRRTDRGIIAPGQAADLVIVNGNVSADIRAVRRIEHIVLGGRFLDPSRLLAEARTIAALDTAELAPYEP